MYAFHLLHMVQLIYVVQIFFILQLAVCLKLVIHPNEVYGIVSQENYIYRHLVIYGATDCFHGNISSMIEW